MTVVALVLVACLLGKWAAQTTEAVIAKLDPSEPSRSAETRAHRCKALPPAPPKGPNAVVATSARPRAFAYENVPLEIEGAGASAAALPPPAPNGGPSAAVEPGTIFIGQTSTLTAYMLDIHGIPRASTPFVVSYPAGISGPTSGTSDAQGHVSLTISALPDAQWGQYRIALHAVDDPNSQFEWAVVVMGNQNPLSQPFVVRVGTSFTRSFSVPTGLPFTVTHSPELAVSPESGITESETLVVQITTLAPSLGLGSPSSIGIVVDGFAAGGADFLVYAPVGVSADTTYNIGDFYREAGLYSRGLVTGSLMTQPTGVEPVDSLTTWTLQRMGDVSPTVFAVEADPARLLAYVGTPGVYTLKAELATGGSFTSAPFLMLSPAQVATDGDCCLTEGESCQLTAYLPDAGSNYSFTDFDFSWGFSLDGFMEPSVSSAVLTKTSANTATLQPAAGLAMGHYNVLPSAWATDYPFGSSFGFGSTPAEIVVAPGLTHVSDILALFIAADGPQTSRVDPVTTSVYRTMAVLRNGSTIPVPVHWTVDPSGSRASFFDPVTLAPVSGIANGSCDADAAEVTLHASSLEVRTSENLVASLCEFSTSYHVDVAYDLSTINVSPLTVTTNATLTMRASDPAGRPLAVHWFPHGSAQGVSMVIPRAFDGHHGSATATYRTARVPGSYRLGVQAAAANAQGYVFLEVLVNTVPGADKPLRTLGDGSNVDPAAKDRGGPGSVSPKACPCPPPCPGDVALSNGEETISATDLFVPGRGEISFGLTRTYLSRIRYDSPIGQGWDLSYNEHLVMEANGDVTVSDGFGRGDTFTRQADGTFLTPREFSRKLIQRPDGTYVVRDRVGFKHFYSATGKLTAHEDRNGNRLTFFYDANGRLTTVRDPYDRPFVFAWGSNGKLASVSDFTGRVVAYSYDANGDLRSVTTPAITGTSTGNDFPVGRTTQYTYSSGFSDPDLNHNLLTIKAPDEVVSGGPPRLSIEYGTDPADPLTYDKVVRIVRGGTNGSGVPAGGNWAFAYELITDPSLEEHPSPAVRKTIQTDPAGNVSKHSFDARGRQTVVQRVTRGLRPGEPDCFCTILTYDEDSHVVRSDRPLGNRTEYVFDVANPSIFARSNLLLVREVPDTARGGGDPLVTTMTYEPLHNQLASITDPRGNASGFVPPLGAPSAERYTQRFFFDYQEGTDPVEEATAFGIDLSSVVRGLSDLNGDGRMDQAHGNVVALRAPAVTLLAGSNEALARGTPAQEALPQLAWNDVGQLVRTVDAEGNVGVLGYHPENDPDGDGTPEPGATSTLPRGYLKSTIADAETSPRRRTSAPPVQIATNTIYDRLGRPVLVMNPRGVVSRLEWNALGELVSTTRASDVSTARATGQLLLDTPAYAYVSRRFYDANGLVIRVQVENRDGNNPGLGAYVETTFAYDILDTVVSSTTQVDASRSLTTTYRYTPDELIERVTKPAGNSINYEYDERNLVFKVTRGFGSTRTEPSTVTYNYDQNANLAEILDPQHVDALGQPTKTSFTHDGFDRVTAVLDALGGSSVVTYDPTSAVVRRQAFGHPAGRPQDPAILLGEQRLSRDERGRVFQVDVPLFLSQVSRTGLTDVLEVA